MNASFFSSLGSFGMPAFWLIAMVVLLIVEGLAPGLVSIWFALGALAALISALLGAPVWLQIVWFLLVSIVTLALTRPLARKYVNGRIVATNADMLVGKECVVTERIDNVLGTGAVTVGGKIWTARMADPEGKAETGERMEVLRIEGVKLIVKPRANGI
jgi:membrane protein implicated in regulation of membrane protease activity